ncbi:hypothetical protein [Pontibacter sp. H249]|uniref:hypothetical protein n=1 Tax=Pontibacter sp. H249 TaxID=3133420 RepID=UPI0030C1960B
MKKFSIYKPQTFYWTRTYKSYAFIIVIIISILVLKFLLNVPETHPAFKFLFLAPILPFIYRIALSLMVTNKYKPLKGKLEGYIIFKKDSIIIDKQTFPIEGIKKIEFDGVDWLGLEDWNRGFRGYFEDPFSQGVNNTLILYLWNGQIIKTRFQKLNHCEFQDIEEVILEYYLKDKLSYLQTVKILCLSDNDEWDRLKKLKQY